MSVDTSSAPPGDGRTAASARMGRHRNEPPARYTLDELLARCDRNPSRRKDDRQWLDAALVGDEIIEPERRQAA